MILERKNHKGTLISVDTDSTVDGEFNPHACEIRIEASEVASIYLLRSEAAAFFDQLAAQCRAESKSKMERAIESQIPRASSLSSPIEGLTIAEKRRLGWLIMWAIDGPEQGFITNEGTKEVKRELHDFLEKNKIPAGGMWSELAKS